jgi:DNA-binding MarR family transcriptional regulator
MAVPDAATVPERDEMQALRAGLDRFKKRFETLDIDAVFALVSLKRIATDLENVAERMCKKFDFSVGRLNVLMALYASPDHSMALSEIGDYLVVTRPNITGLIDGLVRDNFVERIDHPEDRRMVIARLTDFGQRFMAWFVPQHFKNVSGMMSCLEPAELRQLAGYIQRLRQHLKTVEIQPYGDFKP